MSEIICSILARMAGHSTFKILSRVSNHAEVCLIQYVAEATNGSTECQ